VKGEHVQIFRGGAQKISRVVAAKALDVQTLKLAPLVQGANRIVTSSEHPWALTATITGSANLCLPVDFFILGSSTLPFITKQAAAEAASAAAVHQALSAGAPAVAVESGVISDHDWKQNSFPWPFWVVRRSDRADECNCELTAVTVRSVATFAGGGQLGGPFVDSLDISVPMMVNFKPLGKGEELIVFWKSKGPKQVSKVTVSNCLDQAAKLTSKALVTLGSGGGMQVDVFDSAGHLA
jgi:hypothetical protein